MQDWSHYGKGYVRIKAYTQSPERFLNLCAYHKIKVWNLVNKNDIYEMNLSIQDFFRLKSICKKQVQEFKLQVNMDCLSFLSQ